MAKKVYQRQSKSKSLGQTLNGILIGLILGAIIIAVLLWFLNKQKLPTEPPRASEAVETEIIVPNNRVELPDNVSAPQTTGELPNEGETAVGNETEQGAVPSEGGQETVTVPKDTAAAQTHGKPAPERKPTEKATEKPKDTAKESAKAKPKNDSTAKPTPEQILEHGSVEKARAANKNKQESQADKPSSKPAPGSSRQLRLQAGSFASHEQADAQRAKLALLGISASVESAQVGGKSVYRVRTASMDEAKATEVRRQLNANGIDTMNIGAGK